MMLYRIKHVSRPVHPSNNIEAKFDFAAKNGNDVERDFREISFFRHSRHKLNMFNLFRLCRKNRSTCSIRQCCFDIVAGVDGALQCICVMQSSRKTNICDNNCETCATKWLVTVPFNLSASCVDVNALIKATLHMSSQRPIRHKFNTYPVVRTLLHSINFNVLRTLAPSSELSACTDHYFCLILSLCTVFTPGYDERPAQNARKNKYID